MSRSTVTVIDYGIGNLYSVRRALESCDAVVKFASDAEGVRDADYLVLPGVGAFSNGMQGLHERGLVEPLRQYAADGRPMLGICLGMQMLATISEEFGNSSGLELIPGRVVAIPAMAVDGTQHKIPHIGWAGLEPAPDADWGNTPLADTAPGTAVYLLHSFHVVPDDPAQRLADCRYGGHRVTAAIRSGRVFGCQFHPEKSGEAGLRILSRFLAC